MIIRPDTGAQTARGMPDSQFKWGSNAGMFWITKGTGLLRAALILQRQSVADFPDLQLGVSVKRWPAQVSEPAIMLAAMAVECSLKAVLAETVGVVQDGRLDFGDTVPHDLQALAIAANILPANEAEEDALREGQGFITSGRFHTGTRATNTRTSAFVNLPKLIEAYRQLFARAADATAMAQHQSGKYFDPKGKSIDESLQLFRHLVAKSEP